MEVILANPRGFCAGVDMAIDIVEQLLDAVEDQTVHIYHEIVHNRHVVDALRQRGAVFVDEVAAVPEGAILVFSAHGISPAIREQAASRNLRTIDATCPLVTKVHSEAFRYSRRGWQIILIGHRDHQEVIGTLGVAPNSIQVLESPDGIADLTIADPSQLVYLTQTTLSTDDANIIIAALREAFPDISAPPSEDICYATTNRQLAVRSLAQDVDLVLVVGSQNSSNSLRLTEIATNLGKPAILIDDIHVLAPGWHDGVDRILLTAGASAPEHLVREVIDHLAESFDATVREETVVLEDLSFSPPPTLDRFLASQTHPTIEGKPPQ
jgi:4-hydroxy-3-methylbut-2-enyl diphosphate reductase